MLTASEIRQHIYNTVTKNGGHLSSNLGIVDLVLAIHQTFDLEQINLVFDVGHQCYAHKILTKRPASFNTLRQPGGLSGFISPSESPFDLFELGHGGSAINIGVGLALASPHKKTIVITGDGSFVNPQSLGALNLLGFAKNLLVIINNNNYSISPSKGSVINLLNEPEKARQFFTSLHLNFYYEPLGNNTEKLKLTLQNLDTSKHATVLLVKTTKGLTSNTILEDEHGTKHAIIPSLNKTSKTWTQVVSSCLTSFLKHTTKEVYVIQAGMTIGTGMLEVQKILQDHYIDVQMNEEAAIGVAMGIKKGKPDSIVILSFYATFIQRAYDQLINDLARFNLPLLILVNRVGLIDLDGPTHQGIYLNQMFSGISNFDLIYPATQEDVKRVFENFSLKHLKHTVLAYSKENYRKPLIKNQTTTMVDEKVVVMGYGVLFSELVSELINSNVIIYNTYGPVVKDQEYLNYLISRNCKFVTVEEMVKPGSLYEFMASYLANIKSSSKLSGMYVEKKDAPFDTREHLLEINNLTIANLLKLIDN